MFDFQVLCQSSEGNARSGVLQTRHGHVETPVFMPVGTSGTVKSLSPEELYEAGVQILLGNTYHLYLRPGCEVIRHFSGLHRFMHWDGPILTDSGGFQIFSLAKLLTLSEDGAIFQSHIDGSRHVLSPEKAMDVQLCLNSDIMMCLDVCVPYPASREAVYQALVRTTQWAERCKASWDQAGNVNALFGIIQGGMFQDLRQKSMEALCNIEFSGYALGGLSVGEPKEKMMEIATGTLPELPGSKPRYVMGVGTPEDLVELVSSGADMFDCVLPTRNARNGQLFTPYGTLNIANARFRQDDSPVDSECGCYTCHRYSRAYLRHLYTSKELLAYRLNTIHNVYYYVHLLKDMRSAILSNSFDRFRDAFYRKRNR